MITKHISISLISLIAFSSFGIGKNSCFDEITTELDDGFQEDNGSGVPSRGGNCLPHDNPDEYCKGVRYAITGSDPYTDCEDGSTAASCTENFLSYGYPAHI